MITVKKQEGIRVIGPGGVLKCWVRTRAGQPTLVRKPGATVWEPLRETKKEV